MSITIKKSTWADFKSIVSSKSLSMQYEESTAWYNLYAFDGGYVYSYPMKKDSGADQTDFETNYKSGCNVKINADINDNSGTKELHVHDIDGLTALNDIIEALGGQITAADPINFTAIQDVAKNVPVGKKTINTGAEVELIHEVVPAGKKWYITSWDGSGRKEGEYTLVSLNMSYVSSGAIEDFEDVSDWSASEGSFDESTTQVKAGTYSGKWDSFSAGKWTQNTTKNIEKIYGSPVDWSTYRYISYWIYDDSDGQFETWLYLEESSPANTYTYVAMPPALGGWKEFIFDLKEASDAGLDLTDIEHIKIFMKNVGPTVTAPIFYIDNMLYTTSGIESMKSRFFLAADSPHYHVFTTPIMAGAGEEVVVKVRNISSQPAAFEVGINGREVTV